MRRRRTIAASATLALVVVALLLVFDGARFGNARGGNGCSAEQEDLGQYLEFPYTIKIAPENRLYVHGHEITGEAVCTWAPGDTMRINGLAVLPTPRSPEKVIPEERLEEVYKGVPFVRLLVEGGSTWAEAVEAFSEKIDQLYLEAGNRYWDVLERTGSDELAVEAVLDSLDHALLDPESEPRVVNRRLMLDYTGLGREAFDMRTRPDFTRWRTVSRIASEAEARAKLTLWAANLCSVKKPWVVIIRSGGETLVGGEDQARAARKEIDRALETGVVEPEMLSKQALEEILSRRGGERGAQTDHQSWTYTLRSLRHGSRAPYRLPPLPDPYIS